MGNSIVAYICRAGFPLWRESNIQWMNDLNKNVIKASNNHNEDVYIASSMQPCLRPPFRPQGRLNSATGSSSVRISTCFSGVSAKPFGGNCLRDARSYHTNDDNSFNNACKHIPIDPKSKSQSLGLVVFFVSPL